VLYVSLIQAHSFKVTHSSSLIQAHSFKHTHSSTLIQAHSFKLIHSSSFIQAHSFKLIHSSTPIQAHSFNHIHSSTLIPAHSFKLTHSSTFIQAHSFKHTYSSTLIQARSFKHTWAIHKCISIIHQFHLNVPLFQPKLTNSHSPLAKLSPPKNAAARKLEPVTQHTAADMDGRKVWLVLIALGTSIGEFCLCFVFIYACNQTNPMHCLSSVYSVTTPLHVSGLLVAHHQEVTMYICDSWYVLARRANSQLRRTKSTNCNIYKLLPSYQGGTEGVVWGLNPPPPPPKIPKFWQSWAEFPVSWKIHP
jgi:hypothetical protein